MPLHLDTKEYLGTNANHSHSGEYCHYCLKDGEYTVDISMDEMVDIWVKYTDKYNWYSGTGYTPQELRILLNKRLPTLKRWRQKEVTQHVHYEAVNWVRTYIDRNLFQELIPEQLAEMSNLSFYYFRKVFRSITGENIGAYIQRLRLEYIAHLLIATAQPIEELGTQANYQTKFSLAKAFKKHFGVSMSEYRRKYRFVSTIEQKSGNMPEAEIRRINTRKAICMEVGDTFRDKHAYVGIWNQLLHYKEIHLLKNPDNRFVCISPDNPVVTQIEQRRFYIGITVGESIKADGKFSLQEIPGGMYAVFRHKGSYSGLPDFYRTVYDEWFPDSIYHQKHPLTFEVYLNTPDGTSVDELLTEVYIPIDK